MFSTRLLTTRDRFGQQWLTNNYSDIRWDWSISWYEKWVNKDQTDWTGAYLREIGVTLLRPDKWSYSNRRTVYKTLVHEGLHAVFGDHNQFLRVMGLTTSGNETAAERFDRWVQFCYFP